VIDFGRSEDGILYLVMEFLSGKDLATVNAEEGPLPFKRIVPIVRKIASRALSAKRTRSAWSTEISSPRT
jgi:serine/threonine protein kinase